MPTAPGEHVELRDALLGGPRSARELTTRLGISQATLSRLVRAHADDDSTEQNLVAAAL